MGVRFGSMNIVYHIYDVILFDWVYIPFINTIVLSASISFKSLTLFYHNAPLCANCALGFATYEHILLFT